MHSEKNPGTAPLARSGYEAFIEVLTGGYMKLLHIIGARPQFIKYFPMEQAILKVGAAVENRVVHTGQHYDFHMSQIFFEELGLHEPDHHLGVGSGSHGRQTALVLERVESVLMKEWPDLVVVYGDTNSTLGGALAAAKLHIPVAHVEAGLRSFNKKMPEELNRIMTDYLSTWLFCPSKAAILNLAAEGFNVSGPHGYEHPDVDRPAVVFSGDVMCDMFLQALTIAQKRSRILDQLDLAPHTYSLLTLHRAENTDNPDT